MGLFDSLFPSLFGATAKWQQATVDEQLTQFRVFLNNGHNTTVRLWVESGASYGHQASTAALAYRLGLPIGANNQNFAYTGTIEIYYETDDDLPKLQRLIPELLLPNPLIGAATVRAVKYTAVPGAVSTLGFTGGANASTDYIAKLNVDTFVVLQPYRWPGGEVIQRRGQAPIDLTTIAQLGERFKFRLFFLDPAQYTTAPFQTPPYDTDNNVQIVNEVCNNRLTDFKLLTTYSVKSGISRLNTNATYGAALICGSVMTWQKQGGVVFGGAKPTIILNFDDFGTPTASEEPDLRAILSGGIAPSENNIAVSIMIGKNVELNNNIKRRQQFFHALGVAPPNAPPLTPDRFTYLNYPTLLQVQQALDHIMTLGTKNEQVIFIQMGRAPQIFYNYAIYKSTLPPIFEGQNTTNSAINMGIPFMQVPAPNLTVEQQKEIYPSVALTGLSPDAIPTALARVARQINASNQVWPERPADAPCVILGDYYREFTAAKPTDSVYAYFTGLKNFFGQTWQDKLCLAVAYLNTLQGGAGTLAAAVGTTNPLNGVYTKLKAAVTVGQNLNLVPDILSAKDGNIGGYITDLIAKYGNVLALTVNTFDTVGAPDNVTKITLNGPSKLFAPLLGVTCELTVILTAPEGVLTADITFTDVSKWTLDSVPWIVLRDPFVHMVVPNGKLPVMASFGGYYPAMESTNPAIEARLEISVTNDSQWAAAIDFSGQYPGIATAFQMAASLNLVQALPAPFNVLADLGISDVGLQYDYKGKTLQSILVVAQSNTTNIQLFRTVTLDNIKISATLLSPGSDSRTLLTSTSATFSIGTTNPATIGLSVSYPGLALEGSLIDGVITIENLLSTFLPPDYVLNLPQVPSIDQFAFSYVQQTDYLDISLNLNIQWTFTFFDTDLFLLEDVGFGITRQKGSNIGFVTANTTLLPKSAKIGVTVGAYYQGESTWLFQAKQTSGKVSINDLLKEYLGWENVVSFPDLKDLSVKLTWVDKKATNFEFTAATADAWTPISVLPDITVTGNALIGYNFAKAGALVDPRSDVKPGKYGTLSANITLWNIALKVSYDFDPDTQKLCITWLSLKACITKNTGGDTIAVFTLDNKSLGELVEMFVSWATGAKFGLASPWDLLNNITLNGVSVTYNFTKKTVAFTVNIGSIDFGLFKITGITLAYDSTKTSGKVQINVNGTFVWEPTKDSLAWDPTDPSSTPAPPGGGNKYLDLRLLALGQHVTVMGLTEQTEVQGVIKMLRALTVPTMGDSGTPPIPVGGEGQPVFRADNSWFVAMDFGLLKAEDKKSSSTALALADNKPAVYFIQLSIVFNDPILYALQIGLDGPMAKVFAGLNFQIMYRQIADTVGCYSAQIALPNIMRTFEIGVATLTLPVFGIDIYTNGDFQVDIGFPWQMDWSRSFTIAVIVAGIPVLGSAGFYFGKLSSATTNKVPRSDIGWFNPVIVFGFGGRIGLGKSIDAGILKAGFSLTVFGIIEGVIARWQPYTQITDGGDKNQLQDGYFFSITGTWGLQGRLYGSVDFAIIKATVDVSISMYFRITFASYEPILISASASVSISVSLSINLGLFSISISFSFSATISVSFTLQNPMSGTPPWGIPPSTSGSTLLHQRRMARLGGAGSALSATVTYTPNWANLAKGAVLQLNGWIAPGLSVAGDIATKPAEQSICYVVNFFLPVTPPLHTPSKQAGKQLASAAATVQPHELAHAALRQANARSASLLSAAPVSATFEDLAVRVVEWVIAAGLTGSFTPDAVGQQVVTVDYLEAALAYLSDTTTATPMPVAAIETFLQDQAEILFAVNKSAGNSGGAFFPAPPGTVLEVPQYPGQGAPLYQYAFGDYNSSSPSYISDLNTYFNQLLVQMSEQDNAARRVTLNATGAGPSVASFTFSDYFAVVGRQMVQALLDGLKNYKLVIDSAKTTQQLVDDVNKLGNVASGTVVLTTVAELFAANVDHLLTAGSNAVTLKVSGMAYKTAAGQSFTDIAKLPMFNGAFDATALALANADDSRILAASVVVTYNGQTPPYKTQTGDSLASIAAYFGTNVTVQQLLQGTDLLTNSAALNPLSLLGVPSFTYKVAQGDTLANVAARFAVTVEDLAASNAGVVGLFDTASDPNLNVPELQQFQVQALIDESRRSLTLQSIASMTSRFYLNGLRLPTQGLTANHAGLFVGGQAGSYTYQAPELGLFALTGQAFPLPAITGVSPAFSFSLTRGASETWLSLGMAGSATASYAIDTQDDLARYQSLRTYALGNLFESGMTPLQPLDEAAVQPLRYSLAQKSVWQTSMTIVLPQQSVTPTTSQPCLWELPDPLINIPRPGSLLPRFAPILARTEPATGNTSEKVVNNFGFGTLIHFSLRRTAEVKGAASSGRFYEVIGATENDITLLERLLNTLRNDDSSFQQMTLLYRPPSTGSETTGWQSDDQSVIASGPEQGHTTTLMGIGQVNLSTVTRPPTGVTALARTTTRPIANVINPPTEFLRLLWEASITRSGGFYLSYTTAIGSSQMVGLPDRIFSDDDVAEVAMLCLFRIDAVQSTSIASQSVAGYMNVVATDEPLDLSDAALIAKAIEVPLTSRKITTVDTLAALAAEYYTDASVLVQMNPGVTLNGTVVVPGGRYEVPPGQVAPGGDLDAIAKYFNTTSQQIKSANPNRTDWTNPLPPYTGLILPAISVRIGTDPGGSTCASLAAYYNAPLVDIAAANANTTGLLGAGQTLSVVAGPVTIAPLVQAGVTGFQATRIAPTPLPAPGDKNFGDWGSIYVQHTFNMLGYRVAGNADFKVSAWGLPAGPADPNAPATTDKIQAPASPAAGDRWTFTRTLPYTALYSHVPKASNSALPSPADSPYLGVGGLLQFDIAWQDIFGNRILSELTRPQSPANLPASPPSQIAGYTDPLLGVGQWPSIANSYRFVPDSKSQPVLEVMLAFDESQFQGKDAPTKIEHALNTYAQVLFQLSDPNGVQIGVETNVLPGASALLTPAMAAELVQWVENLYAWLVSLSQGTTPPVLEPVYTLSVSLNAAQLNAGQIFRVTASLTISRNPHLAAGQLAAAPGIATTSSTLAPWTGPMADPTTQATEYKAELTDYLYWRAFPSQAPPPPTPGTPAYDTPQRDIAAFSHAFTAAFSSLSGVSFHVAAGADSDSYSSGSANNLWAVQLGDAGKATGISYSVDNAGAPTLFAPRPISTKLISRDTCPVIGYTTGKVIATTDPSTNVAFADIDLDQWMRDTLTQIDALLTPRYVAPALLLRSKSNGDDALQMVLDAKKALAGAMKTAMIPVFDGETATPEQLADVQEAFYQSMLGALSQYYAVKAGIQFSATVNAAIAPGTGDTDPPRLYGNIVSKATVQTPPASVGSTQPSDNISLSSPKLNLAFAGGQPVSHLLSFLLSSTTSAEANILLNLDYGCQSIEHQITRLPGIQGYQPSTWLSFADDVTAAGKDWPLSKTLGQFSVPLVLRAFPATPTLVQQESVPAPTSACYTPPSLQATHSNSSGLLTSGTCSQPGTFNPLAEATLWNYSFTYSLQIHSLHDAIHGEIDFNQTVTPNLTAMVQGGRDLFDNLAEFVTVYPKIQADLDQYLAPLDADTTDATVIVNAQTALESAAKVIQWIADTAVGLGAGAHLRSSSLVSALRPVTFTISEEPVTVKDKGDDVLCVTVALGEALPPRIGSPLLQIPGYNCQPYPGGDATTFKFVYTDSTGNYLTTAIAASIAERQFILPSLNVLERQDAAVSVFLTRNEFSDGRKIASAFVYTTPTVSLPSPLLPTISVPQPGDATTIDLALINSVDGKTPVLRSLSCQLAQLYEVLFANSGTDSVTLTMTTYYEYSLSSQLPSVRLPVYLMPPTQVAVRNGGTGVPLDQLVANQAAACSAWFDGMKPSVQAAAFFFDLTIMSDLTAQPMPILHISNLTLPLSEIDPPMA